MYYGRFLYSSVKEEVPQKPNKPKSTNALSTIGIFEHYFFTLVIERHIQCAPELGPLRPGERGQSDKAVLNFHFL